MVYADRIRTKLTAAFAPLHLDVQDESGRHQGHAGARPEGETHFRVVMVSAAFQGLGRIARHRRVYETLTGELQEHVHALALELFSPDEYNRR